MRLLPDGTGSGSLTAFQSGARRAKSLASRCSTWLSKRRGSADGKIGAPEMPGGRSPSADAWIPGQPGARVRLLARRRVIQQEGSAVEFEAHGSAETGSTAP